MKLTRRDPQTEAHRKRVWRKRIQADVARENARNTLNRRMTRDRQTQQ